MRLFSVFFLFFVVCFFRPVQARASDAMPETFQSELTTLKQIVTGLQSRVGELATTVQSQNEVIQSQMIRINALEGTRDVIAQPAQASAGAPRTVGLSGFNPEIGLVADITGKLTQSKIDGEGNNTIVLKELELNFAQVVDPFSRLDAVISFNDAIEDQNVEIEEGYYTHWGLPFGFLGQLGKFRSKVGKQNLLHLDQLETVDYPIVIRDFFGEEGLAASGARLQNHIPNPWDIPLEITGEVLRGNNGTSFSGISRRPIFNMHVKSYFDLSKDANLELGWTTLFGDENPPVDDGTGTGTLINPSEGQDRYGVKVFGGDATLSWYLPEGRKVKWQNEIYFQNRTNLVHVNSDPWGFYSLLDFKFSPRFSTGVRFDYLQPLNVVDEHGQTIGISPYVTLRQSEFANFKLQYTRLEPAAGSDKTDNALYLKANVIIGAHKHPVQ
jgi:hypothetical protein